AHPDAIHLPDAVHAMHVELPLEPIGRDRMRVLRVGGADTPTARRAANQAVGPHEPRDALPADTNALRPELLMHAGGAVGLVAPPMRDPHVEQQPLVGAAVRAARAAAPRLEPGRRDIEHAAHESHGVLVTMTSDAGVLHRDSLAKNAAAFFANSASCLSVAFSRRRRRTSCSSVSPL